MTQINYTTELKGSRVVITIEASDQTFDHSVPLSALELKQDPEAELERIVADVAEARMASPGKPDWLPDSGTVSTGGDQL